MCTEVAGIGYLKCIHFTVNHESGIEIRHFSGNYPDNTVDIIPRLKKN